MKKNWNAEWDMEQAEVDEMIASFKAMQECDHEWMPRSETLPGMVDDAEECAKCGGVQITLSEADFAQFKGALDAGED